MPGLTYQDDVIGQQTDDIGSNLDLDGLNVGELSASDGHLDSVLYEHAELSGDSGEHVLARTGELEHGFVEIPERDVAAGPTYLGVVHCNVL